MTVVRSLFIVWDTMSVELRADIFLPTAIWRSVSLFKSFKAVTKLLFSSWIDFASRFVVVAVFHVAKSLF